MHRGFVCMWRKSLDSSVMRNVNVWYFWCWCLMKASHKEFIAVIGFKEVPLLPGQFIFGRRKAASELPLSEQEIRTCVQFLEKIGNLTIKSTQRFSIISIVNWDIYQNNENRVNPNINPLPTHCQPTANHIQQQQPLQPEILSSPETPPVKPKRKKRVSELTKDQLDSFMKFWAVWPKRVAQADAEKAWVKIAPTNGQVEIICHAVEKWKASPKWQENNGEFIPYPATWLNGKRWRDEIKSTNNQTEYRIPIIQSGDNSIFADPE